MDTKHVVHTTTQCGVLKRTQQQQAVATKPAHTTILARSTFNVQQQQTGSTARELDAVLAAVQAVRHSLRGKCINLFTDNTGVVQILKKGFASTDALRTTLSKLL